ncbi:MAG: U32 family peptidase [Bacilli bacterium]|nr:U32 family peptidase [Bacilli bacterium]
MSELLLTVKELKDIEKYSADGYVLGYEKYTFFGASRFSYDEIASISNKANVFVLLNALIHENNIEDFNSEINKLAKLDVNFIVQDTGALSLILKQISPKRVVFNPYTMICNKNDFSAYQNEGILGIGISSQLFIEETIELSKLDNALILLYGYEPIYQSNRKVLSLYQEAKKVRFPNGQLYLREDTRDVLYSIIENEYGSVIFNCKKVNLIRRIKDIKEAKYLLIDTFLSSEDEIDNVIKELNE